MLMEKQEWRLQLVCARLLECLVSQKLSKLQQNLTHPTIWDLEPSLTIIRTKFHEVQAKLHPKYSVIVQVPDQKPQESKGLKSKESRWIPNQMFLQGWQRKTSQSCARQSRKRSLASLKYITIFNQAMCRWKMKRILSNFRLWPQPHPESIK